MVLNQCSIKYSLLFYFTGFLGEAGGTCGLLEPPRPPRCPLPMSALAWGWPWPLRCLARPSSPAPGQQLGWSLHAGGGSCLCTVWDEDLPPAPGQAGVPRPPERHHGAGSVRVQRGLLGGSPTHRGGDCGIWGNTGWGGWQGGVATLMPAPVGCRWPLRGPCRGSSGGGGPARP